MKFRACVLVASCWLLCFSVGCHKPAKAILMIEPGSGGIITPGGYLESGGTIEILSDPNSSAKFPNVRLTGPGTATCSAPKTDPKTNQTSVVCWIPKVNTNPTDQYKLTLTPVGKDGEPLTGVPASTSTFYVRPCPPICK
jgi:hypothetical protein